MILPEQPGVVHVLPPLGHTAGVLIGLALARRVVTRVFSDVGSWRSWRGFRRSPDLRLQHLGDLEPRHLTRKAALGHVVAAMLDRGVIQLQLLAGVPAGELYQLVEDLAARLGTFVGHASTVGPVERMDL